MGQAKAVAEAKTLKFGFEICIHSLSVFKRGEMKATLGISRWEIQ